ncbi:MAG: type II toxin-antitoxin system RelE/ParE family toxin [Pseudomonadota bacterium]
MNTINSTEEFTKWLLGLKDTQGKARILARIKLAKHGHFGDCKSLGDGVSEMRIHTGAGYRVYYCRKGELVYLLLAGGDKSTQVKDIEKAKTLSIRYTI